MVQPYNLTEILNFDTPSFFLVSFIPNSRY